MATVKKGAAVDEGADFRFCDGVNCARRLLCERVTRPRPTGATYRMGWFDIKRRRACRYFLAVPKDGANPSNSKKGD